MDFSTFLHILGLIAGTLLVLGVGWLMRGRFVKAEPNEWMIVLRDGKPTKMGIGLSGFVGWYDTLVKYPSQINKVSFTMQQVTSENQGVEISGVLLWSIYRVDEGPFLAYQKLGEDLQTGNPAKANDDLRDTTYSILRQKIANSTIMDIIKSRNKIRDAVKKELNGLVNTWGVWVENVDITDVRILSGALFKNLQTKFREDRRKEAEMIQMEIQKELNEVKTRNTLDYNKKNEENRTKIAVAQTEKGVKLESEYQVVYEHDLRIETKKDNLRKDCNIKKKEFEYAYYTERDKIDAEVRKIKHTQTMVQLDKEHESAMVRVETEKILTEKTNEMKGKEEQFCRELQISKLEAEHEAYQGRALRMKVLETLSEVYQSLPAKEVRVVNFGEGNNNQAMTGLAQAIHSLDTVKQTIVDN